LRSHKSLKVSCPGEED